MVLDPQLMPNFKLPQLSLKWVQFTNLQKKILLKVKFTHPMESKVQKLQKKTEQKFERHSCFWEYWTYFLSWAPPSPQNFLIRHKVGPLRQEA